jgi:hypothetical protein
MLLLGSLRNRCRRCWQPLCLRGHGVGGSVGHGAQWEGTEDRNQRDFCFFLIPRRVCCGGPQGSDGSGGGQGLLGPKAGGVHCQRKTKSLTEDSRKVGDS